MKNPSISALLLVTASLWNGPCFSEPSLPNYECAITFGASVGTPCQTVTSTATFWGARSDPGGADNGQAAGPIDVHGRCRYVDNISASSSVFVPFRSTPEWLAFTTTGSAPTNIVNLVHCTRTMPVQIPPDSNCMQPSPAVRSTSLPYERYPDPATGQPFQMTVLSTFQCTGSPSAATTPWRETATAVYQGLDSDNNYDASWRLMSLVYSAPASTDGQCGPANGQNMNSPPTSGLCSAGTASAISGSSPGPFTWACNGSGNGQPAYCSTATTCSISGQSPFMIAGVYILNGESCDQYVAAGSDSEFDTFWNTPDCPGGSSISSPPGYCVTKRDSYDARQEGCGGPECQWCDVYIKACSGPAGGGGGITNPVRVLKSD